MATTKALPNSRREMDRLSQALDGIGKRRTDAIRSEVEDISRKVNAIAHMLSLYVEHDDMEAALALLGASGAHRIG